MREALHDVISPGVAGINTYGVKFGVNVTRYCTNN